MNGWRDGQKKMEKGRGGSPHPLFGVEACAALTELEMEDVAAIGVLAHSPEGGLGLDGLSLSDRHGREA